MSNNVVVAGPWPSEPGSVVPQTLGPYTIIKKLGSGGFATVYKARKGDGPVIALKTARTDEGEDAARLTRERAALSAMSHHNIVRCEGLVPLDDMDLLLLPLEFAGDSNLKQRLHSMQKLGNKMSEASVVEVGTQIADAMAHAHERGILHRDLKPDNIMFDEDGVPRLGDFGLAKSTSGDFDMTRLGSVMGTPGYTSPEQVMGEAATERSDIFAVGVLIYVMLTGIHPFTYKINGSGGMFEIQKMMSVTETEPLPVTKNGKFEAWENFFDRMLSKDPANRPQTMTVVRQHLQIIEEYVL